MTGLGDSALLLSAPDGQSNPGCRVAWTARRHLRTGTEHLHPSVPIDRVLLSPDLGSDAIAIPDGGCGN